MKDFSRYQTKKEEAVSETVIQNELDQIDQQINSFIKRMHEELDREMESGGFSEENMNFSGLTPAKNKVEEYLKMIDTIETTIVEEKKKLLEETIIKRKEELNLLKNAIKKHLSEQNVSDKEQYKKELEEIEILLGKM